MVPAEVRSSGGLRFQASSSFCTGFLFIMGAPVYLR